MPEFLDLSPSNSSVDEGPEEFLDQMSPSQDEPQRRQRRERSDKGIKRGPRGPNKGKRPDRLKAEIGDDVAQIIGIISLGLSTLSPTAAEFNEQRVDKTTDDVIRLCIRHPRLLELIKQTGDVTAYVGLLELGVGIAVAVGIDREKIDPNFFVARALGVTKAYEVAYEGMVANGNETQGQANGSGEIQTPALLARTTNAG